MALYSDSWRGGGTGRGAYILTPATAAQVPLTIDLAAAQTAVGFRIRNSGGTTLFSVDPDGDISIAGNLDAVINETLTGNISLSGNLSATGTSTLTGAVTAGTTFSVTGASTFTGVATFLNNINANGSVTIAGNVTNIAGTAYARNLFIIETSAAPASVSAYGGLYCNDVGGVTELFYIDDTGATTQLTNAGIEPAPANATYITQTANGTLTAEQALSTLATGYMRVTTGTGAITSQAVPIPLADGGTNAALTASNGGIFYSTATAGAILAGTATAGQMLQSGASAAPTWSTATFPAVATGTGTILRADGTNWVASTLTMPDTAAVSTILYASATNVISALATANSGILITGGTGIPSIATDIPTAVTIGTAYIYRVGGTDVSLADGGTNASLTASNGGVFYSTATAGAILAGTATANQVLLSGLSTTPAWSTATYPATTVVSEILYSSATNTIAGLATAASGVLVTSAGSVPSIATDIPTAVTIGSGYIYRAGGTDVALADGGTGASLVDPNADRILFWDDSATATAFLTLGNGLTITLTTIDVDSASDTVDGIVELATAAETTTGTDATRAVTPDGFAGSDYGKRLIQVKVMDDATVVTTGDGKIIFCIPVELNGMNLVDADAYVTTVSSSGLPTIQIRNVTQAADMLTTRITIDASEFTSYTAVAAPVIDAANDDVATGDRIAIDVDVAGTGAQGLGILLAFATP